MADEVNTSRTSVPSTTGSSDPVAAIRDAIIRGEFAPNQRLVEVELAEEFKMSRAAVRSVLLQLTGEGLVERVQNRSARVRAVSTAEAIEVTEVRLALEGLCAGKAADHVTGPDRQDLRQLKEQMQEAAARGDVMGYAALDRRLHEYVLNHSDQSTARTVLDRLRGQTLRHQLRIAMYPGRPAESLPQCTAIIDALCAGAPETAKEAMDAHLRSVLEVLRVQQDIRPAWAAPM